MKLREEIANEWKDVQGRLKKDWDILLSGPGIDVVLQKIITMAFIVFCIFPFFVLGLALQSSSNK